MITYQIRNKAGLILNYNSNYLFYRCGLEGYTYNCLTLKDAIKVSKEYSDAHRDCGELIIVKIKTVQYETEIKFPLPPNIEELFADYKFTVEERNDCRIIKMKDIYNADKLLMLIGRNVEYEGLSYKIFTVNTVENYIYIRIEEND